VAVQRLWQHPKYPKLVRRTSKFMAHDETNACNMGDEVGFPDPAFFFPVSERESFMYNLVVVTIRSLANKSLHFDDFDVAGIARGCSPPLGVSPESLSRHCIALHFFVKSDICSS
jgi:ribosomal protein S17